MTAIQIFDPALCCSTGICGMDADQEPVGVERLLALAVGRVVPFPSEATPLRPSPPL